METGLPKISVVVPSYNQGEFLPQALESIFAQKYPNLETVVMDGGSSDQSLKVIRSYGEKLKYWQSQPDGGQANAINMGMQHCTGNIVTWLNSDDWYVNDPFWVVARAYQEHPGSGLFVGNGFRYKEGNFTPFCPRHIAISREILTEGLDYILQPATFMSREAWLQSGGLNGELHYGLDWDLFIRILEKYSAVAINEFLAVSREHEQAKTSSGHLTRAGELLKIASQNVHKKDDWGSAHYLMMDAINEFLAISNEHHKVEPISSLDAIRRDLSEIIAQVGRYTITPGSAFYLLETLLGICAKEAGFPEDIRGTIYIALQRIQQEMKRRWDTPDPFPTNMDPQDRVYIPFAKGLEDPAAARQMVQYLPKISIIIPSYNQSDFLPRTLDSVISQKYPSLEILVYDGGSTDGSVEILEQYASHLTYWISEPDQGPAHAINKGFAKATGEIIGWLNSDDVLTEGSLWRIAQEFIQEPGTEVVFGNALYIDEFDNILLADHGIHKTGLYYGKLEPISNVPYYWTYIHAVPQPTVYFRRQLLEETGMVNQSYHYIFDFEFFWRLRKTASFKKIEKTLALYRIHSRSKTSNWNKFIEELFRFSRPLWPKKATMEYRATLASLVSHYFPRHGRLAKQAIKLLVEYEIISPEKIAPTSSLKRFLTGISRLSQALYGKRIGLKNRLMLSFHSMFVKKTNGNGKQFHIHLPNTQPRENPAYSVPEGGKIFTISFCGFHYPRHPGYSGGEIRDFHILRKLLEFSTLDFFALWSAPANGRLDYLRSYFRMVYEPDVLNSHLPHRIDKSAMRMTLKTRLLLWMRRKNIPVIGPRHHNDSYRFVFPNRAYVLPSLELSLKAHQPDFLIIGPQLNPLPLQIKTITKKTRLILSSYDVEAIRLERMSASQTGLGRKAMQLEARRSKVFEKDTLDRYDGIIAVSDLDKRAYTQRYQFDPDRILVLDNSVDTEYFSYQPRIKSDQPNIVFIGSLNYWPNHEAARRLLVDIMPLVRTHHPDARAWIVGQAPSRDLLVLSDGVKNIVTGQVDDVRPFLDIASVACIPLRTGSGTKYKVLEAASAGAPIVCTTLALEGLSLKPNDHILVGESNQELADAVIRSIESFEESTQRAQNASNHVDKYYSWNSNLRRLPSWLETIRKMPRRNNLMLDS